MEKCFCAKSDLCPTINETDESVVSDTNKVCVSIACVYCLLCCVVLNVVGQNKDISSSERVVLKNTKVFIVLLCWC